MRKLKNFLSFSAVVLVTSALAACGALGSKTSENAPAKPAPESKSPAPVAQNSPANDAQRSIAGDYTVTGSNVDGQGRYEGSLTITPRDDVYQFSWLSGGKSSDGVGVMTGNKVAVAFTEGTDGKGCGVVLYKILPNGDLDGKAGYWGVNTSEGETGKRTKGTDLDGEYAISGKNTDGQSYDGTLKVAKDGDGYSFQWNTGSVLKGFGIRQGDTVSVGIGGPQCSFVSYEIKADGTLEGKWGGQTSKSFGTEVAKKK
ncbi:MAG: hypothetical protein K1X52_02980 [Pyrinomonadaceae bacterium]|nr:hypothetical protein [Pyrinomonadaceae bacterium]